MVRRGKAPDIFQAGSQPDNNVHLLSPLKCSYQGFQTDRFPSWTSQALSVIGVNQSKARTKSLRHVMPDTCACVNIGYHLKESRAHLDTRARHLGANMSPGSCEVGSETPGTTCRGREEERRASERGPREGSWKGGVLHSLVNYMSHALVW